eukprot:gene27353-34062_t
MTYEYLVESKKDQSADDLFGIDDTLIPTFDDAFIPSLDDLFDDGVITADDGSLPNLDDLFSFDDDLFSFDDILNPTDDNVYVDGYISYQFSYGDVCAANKTFAVGAVAGACFADIISSYMILFSDVYSEGTDTFYSSMQGSCTSGQTLTLGMDSVLVSLYEASTSCATSPVLFAALAKDICLDISGNSTDTELSALLTCDADNGIVGVTNYTSSSTCTSSSPYGSDVTSFELPTGCYSPESVPSADSATKASDVMTGDMEAFKKSHLFGHKNKRITATVKKMVDKEYRKSHVKSRHHLKEEGKDMDTEMTVKVDTKRNHLRTSKSKKDSLSADDLLGLDDTLIPTLDDDTTLPDFDDLFSDDLLPTFDDDFWSFDDDSYSEDDISVSVSCVAKDAPIVFTSQPSFAPTPEPTVFSTPTYRPTHRPSAVPTARPSTQSAVPSAVTSTTKPSSSSGSGTSVKFTVYQVLNGITLSLWNADAPLYTATLKSAISACMDGLTADNIVSFGVSQGSSAAASSAGVLSLSTLRGLDVTPLTTSSDFINMNYTVSVTNSAESYDSLSSELSYAIAEGIFDTYLTTFATANQAAVLLNCSSSSDSSVNELGGAQTDSVSSGSTTMSGDGVAGVVIAVLIVFAAVLCGVYYYYFRDAMSSNSNDSSVTTTTSPAPREVDPEAGSAAAEGTHNPIVQHQTQSPTTTATTTTTVNPIQVIVNKTYTSSSKKEAVRDTPQDVELTSFTGTAKSSAYRADVIAAALKETISNKSASATIIQSEIVETTEKENEVTSSVTEGEKHEEETSTAKSEKEEVSNKEKE